MGNTPWSFFFVSFSSLIIIVEYFKVDLLPGIIEDVRQKCQQTIDEYLKKKDTVSSKSTYPNSFWSSEKCGKYSVEFFFVSFSSLIIIVEYFKVDLLPGIIEDVRQ